MSKRHPHLADLLERSAFYLSGPHQADTSSPDSLESPGALFLTSLTREVVERIEYQMDSDGDTLQKAVTALRKDASHEMADEAVPIYTHDLWKTFTDLGAYQEDMNECGPVEDAGEAAKLCLYMIALRLVDVLLDELVECASDLCEECQDRLDVVGNENERGGV